MGRVAALPEYHQPCPARPRGPLGTFPPRQPEPAEPRRPRLFRTVRPSRRPSRVKIQEADAKSLLLEQGLPVPRWAVAHTAQEAREAAERELADGASKVVVKAQVLVGGRGK